MVTRGTLTELFQELPYSLREEVVGYGISINEAAEQIIKDAGVKYNQELSDNLVFVACMRRLWSKFEVQYWILDNSLALCKKNEVTHIKIGGNYYGYESDQYNELRLFIRNFELLLTNMELYDLVKMGSLKEIVIDLADK